MILTCHHRLFRAAVMLATFAVAGNAGAQTFPNRPLRLIVPFAAGSTADNVARVLSAKLTEQLGQQVIVDTRPGGTGLIGIEVAKNAPPDGYTLLMAGITALALLPALKPRLPYDADKDFVALSRVTSTSNVVIVHPALGVGSVAELVKSAKARPGQLNYGSAGHGSGSHIGGEMFNLLAGVKTVHVPYKSANLVLPDLIAGQVQFMIVSAPAVMSQVKAGRVKMIATTGTVRDPLLPELPTVAEVLPGYEITSWTGIAVPAKTPAAIVNRLHGDIVKALRTTDVREQYARQGATAHPETAAEFSAFIKAERERIARIGRQVGITLD